MRRPSALRKIRPAHFDINPAEADPGKAHLCDARRACAYRGSCTKRSTGAEFRSSSRVLRKSVSPMARLFISHSSLNSDKAIELRDWLAKNGWDDVFLDLDPERGIAAGQRWKEA